MLPFFFFFSFLPPISFLRRKSVSLPPKFAFSRTITVDKADVCDKSVKIRHKPTAASCSSLVENELIGLSQ